MKLALDTLTLDDVVTAAEVLRQHANAQRGSADLLAHQRKNYLNTLSYLHSRAESCDKVADVLLSGARVE